MGLSDSWVCLILHSLKKKYEAIHMQWFMTFTLIFVLEGTYWVGLVVSLGLIISKLVGQDIIYVLVMFSSPYLLKNKEHNEYFCSRCFPSIRLPKRSYTFSKRDWSLFSNFKINCSCHKKLRSCWHTVAQNGTTPDDGLWWRLLLSS